MNNGTVYISLTSHLPGEEANVRQMKADLKRLQKDDFHALRLSYEQVLDLDSGEKIPEIMTFRIGDEGRITRISMKRPKTAVLMEFEEGKTCFASYPTPAGILDVQIRTRKVEGALRPDSLYADVCYEILLGNASQGEIRFRIEARPMNDTETF